MVDHTEQIERVKVKLRAFATEIGNGGPSFRGSSAGPFYGIYPLGECIDELLANPTDSL